MIEVEALHKSFGKLHVLKGIDLVVDSGKAIAVLGPNGSGKTTLIKSILGLVRPSSGDIKVDGASSFNGQDVRQKIGYMPQISHFPDNLSTIDILKLIGLIRDEFPDRSELVEFFDLKPHLHKAIKELSGGTIQKVSAMIAFLYDADYIVLDEPTVGLDPISRIKLKELILEKKQTGKTILFTSHILSDVEEVADEIVFMLEGVLVYRGAPQKMIEEMGERNLERAIAKYLQQAND